jgi:hypothetical protein
MPVSSHTLFVLFLVQICSKKLLLKTSTYVIEKLNEAMSLENRSVLVWWEDVTTEELMELHDVVLKLDIARGVKCSVKDYL